MKNRVNMMWRKFGRLVVKKEIRTLVNNEQARFECLCVCGNRVIVRGDLLRMGHTKSCGCLASEASKRNIVKANQARWGVPK